MTYYKACLVQSAKYIIYICTHRQIFWPTGLHAAAAADSQSVLEDEETGERGVHVAVQVGGSVQQQQPDLIIALQTQNDDVRRCRPVRDALCPYRRNHPAVLYDHHRCLSKQQQQLNILLSFLPKCLRERDSEADRTCIIPFTQRLLSLKFQFKFRINFSNNHFWVNSMNKMNE